MNIYTSHFESPEKQEEWGKRISNNPERYLPVDEGEMDEDTRQIQENTISNRNDGAMNVSVDDLQTSGDVITGRVRYSDGSDENGLK